MEFLQGRSLQTTVAVAVAVVVVAVAAGTAFLLRSKKRKGCLDPENFKEFKLVEKKQLSHNVAKFKFALPTPTSVLGLPIGRHISCRGQGAAGEEVIKPYTPTTLDSDVGYFELVIKMYPQGRMSHHFREMKVGDYLSVKGPKGRFKYQPCQVRAFGMLAGGSGITPMFQVTRAILENPNDNTKVHLIYANVTYEDILLKFGEITKRIASRWELEPQSVGVPGHEWLLTCDLLKPRHSFTCHVEGDDAKPFVPPSPVITESLFATPNQSPGSSFPL